MGKEKSEIYFARFRFVTRALFTIRLFPSLFVIFSFVWLSVFSLRSSSFSFPLLATRKPPPPYYGKPFKMPFIPIRSFAPLDVQFIPQ